MSVDTIPHSKPTINAGDIAGAAQVLKSGHLAQGKKVVEFEGQVSRYLGMTGAVATSSGTSALHLALLALGVGRGDEVIVPSYVCCALLNPILHAGAVPKIVDVHPDDFNIDPAQVRKKLSKKTKIIIVPHLFGYPADMKGLLRLGIPIIEDCAQSIGAEYEGRKAGAWGVLCICSFYATKVLTTAEGGMVLSHRKKLLDDIRDRREYDKALTYKVRYNYKMTDVQAALGLSQLARLPQFIARRKAIARIYNSMDAHPQIKIPDTAAGRDHIYYRYVIKLKTGQKAFLQKLNKQGIGAARPVFSPLHRYFNQGQCPVADELMKQCISIPIYPSLTNAQAQYIVEKTS
ncbi:MAG: DegT/DnrJ/EryC1/StrS family aminotransferase, partial [Candidatus Omnitrophica bacterium]|nr:DegT/DnrJ/EryC1/StrS family aminotransferase [Candidatus Omnitrophota bacterium]